MQGAVSSPCRLRICPHQAGHQPEREGRKASSASSELTTQRFMLDWNFRSVALGMMFPPGLLMPPAFSSLLVTQARQGQVAGRVALG